MKYLNLFMMIFGYGMTAYLLFCFFRELYLQQRFDKQSQEFCETMKRIDRINEHRHHIVRDGEVQQRRDLH